MKRKWLAFTAAGCLLLTSCSILPEEEQFRTAPLINQYQQEDYEQAQCVRGDLSVTKSISCVYVPVRTEILSFDIGGVPFDQFFVKVGDTVNEGDLLIQLDISNLQDSIASAQRELESLNVRMHQLEDNRELALKRVRMTNMTGNDLQEALDRVDEQYDSQALSLQDSIDLTRLRLDDYQSELERRQLRATISGTVTYVRKINPGDTSTFNERVVNIADSTMSLFRAETEYWDRFNPGDLFTITSSKIEYEAIVVTEEELGLPASKHEEGKKAYVYFKLTEPSFDLEDSDRGTLTLLLDSRTNVLYVPSTALSRINDESVVYYQGENGQKAYKNVVTGLETGKLTEIISGLDEGEYVIIN